MSLVLSLFPGIGLLDMAFEEEGFCIVRGPDLLWGGDIKRFHPPAGKFDGVIGGPPCQLFSIMKRLNPKAGEKIGNLIPEFERCISEAQPRWFLMENVWPDSPEPRVPGYATHRQCIRDVWVGGNTNRPRAITWGTALGRRDLSAALEIETLALHRPDPEPAVLAGGGGRSQPVAIGGSGRRKNPRSGPHTGPRESLAQLCRASGLPEDFFDGTPFTKDGAVHALGNGVPLPMGRAIAKAVKRALEPRAGAGGSHERADS